MGTRRCSTASRRNSISTCLSRRSAKHYKSLMEVEAVVSCSSDALVVVLRHARPSIPQSLQQLGHPIYANNLLASPRITRSTLCRPEAGRVHSVIAASKNVAATTSGGPEPDQLMKAIRDAAALAHASIGVDGSLKFVRMSASCEGAPAPQWISPSGA